MSGLKEYFGNIKGRTQIIAKELELPYRSCKELLLVLEKCSE